MSENCYINPKSQFSISTIRDILRSQLSIFSVFPTFSSNCLGSSVRCILTQADEIQKYHDNKTRGSIYGKGLYIEEIFCSIIQKSSTDSTETFNHKVIIYSFCNLKSILIKILFR